VAYEKMPCKYDTLKDLQDRLHGTYCRYDGKLYYVTVESKDVIVLYDSVSQRPKLNINPSDPNFDISSLEVGYMNLDQKEMAQLGVESNGGVLYLMRYPQRRYRQGVTPECLSAYRIENMDISPFRTGSLLRTAGFRKSIEGDFPSFNEALDDKSAEVALSRDLAIKKTDSGLVLVYYKMVNIGWTLPGDNIVMFRGTPHDWLFQKILDEHHMSYICRRVQ